MIRNKKRINRAGVGDDTIISGGEEDLSGRDSLAETFVLKNNKGQEQLTSYPEEQLRRGPEVRLSLELNK